MRRTRERGILVGRDDTLGAPDGVFHNVERRRVVREHGSERPAYDLHGHDEAETQPDVGLVNEAP